METFVWLVCLRDKILQIILNITDFRVRVYVPEILVIYGSGNNLSPNSDTFLPEPVIT